MKLHYLLCFILYPLIATQEPESSVIIPSHARIIPPHELEKIKRGFVPRCFKESCLNEQVKDRTTVFYDETRLTVLRSSDFARDTLGGSHLLKWLFLNRLKTKMVLGMQSGVIVNEDFWYTKLGYDIAFFKLK